MKKIVFNSAFFLLIAESIFTTTSFAQTMAGGWAHSVFICSDKTVMACGYNANGQLGNGTNTDSNIPVSVNNITDVKAVGAGQFHSIALKNDSTVWTWGGNTDGQLGDGTNTSHNIPVNVSSLSGITSIAGGVYHCLAVKSDSTVWTWGNNTYGQLGNGTIVNSNFPVQVNSLTGITAVAGGTWHSLALRNDSTVWTWGNNGNGELGNGTNVSSSVPVQVSFLTGVIAIAGGQHFSLALKSDSTVWAWGYNAFFQLGNGTGTSSNVPVQVTFLTGITAISAGGFQLHSVALKSDNTVWTWGWNDYGELGNGTIVPSNVPIQIGITDGAFCAVGNVHSMLLKHDGTVWVWGWNLYGTLGIGSNTDEYLPVQLTGLCQMSAVLPVAAFAATSFLCPGICTDFINISLNATSYQWSFPGASPSTSTDTNPQNICYSTPGSYDVQLIATGANGSDTLLLSNYITVYPPPAPQGILQNGDTLFANAGAASYQWYYNGNVIAGATDYFYVAQSNGDYNLIATDANGCEVEAVIFDVMTSVQSTISSLQSAIVNPNPVSDKLEIKNLISGTTAKISIYNSLGEKVLAVKQNASNLSQDAILNVSHLQSGIYWLEINSNNKILRTKFVKQ